MWVHTKRIKDEKLRAAARVLDGTPKGKGPRGDTHVCILCWKRLTPTRDMSRNGGTGAFLTSVALAHMREAHPHVNEASKSQSGIGGKERTVASILAVGMSPDKGTLGAFHVSPATRALPLAARYYVYGRYKSHMCFVLFLSSPPSIIAWPFVFITFQ